MDYVVWDWRVEANDCVLIPPEGIERDWELYKGVPRASNFPSDALFRMSDDHPKDMGLTDNLKNIGTLLVASVRLKNFFEAMKLVNLEYLPVSIINHKNRVASKDYFIVHPVGVQDCLDIAASGCSYSSIISTDIIHVDSLVIEPARVDPRVALFRIKDFGEPLLIHRELAIELLEADFTGLYFLELDEF